MLGGVQGGEHFPGLASEVRPLPQWELSCPLTKVEAVSLCHGILHETTQPPFFLRPPWSFGLSSVVGIGSFPQPRTPPKKVLQLAAELPRVGLVGPPSLAMRMYSFDLLSFILSNRSRASSSSTALNFIEETAGHGFLRCWKDAYTGILYLKQG